MSDICSRYNFEKQYKNAEGKKRKIKRRLSISNLKDKREEGDFEGKEASLSEEINKSW